MRMVIRKLLLCFVISALLFAGCGTEELLPSKMLNSTDQFVAEAELLGNVACFGNFLNLQGGCFSEEFAWFALLDVTTLQSYKTTECCVVKYDRSTMEEIACSEVMKLGHANDITYIEKTNELYVIHCNDRKVSVLDADSLEIKGEKKLKLDCYAIDYDSKNDRFVTAIGKTSVCFWDKNLKLTGGRNAAWTTLITQGICADDTYVYHVLWSSPSNEEEPENMVFVNDWEGNLITKIPLGVEDFEPENISLVGDAFYISCNNLSGDGRSVFKVKIVKAE